MIHCSFFCLPDHFHRKRPLLLIVFFLLGHLLGVWISGHASDFLLSAMRTVVSSRVSIMGLLSTLALPFLVSAFAVYLGQPILLFPIAFWKAFLFSYTACTFLAAWGSAGWLVTPLVMCGSVCSMPVLCWYWLRHVEGERFRWSTFSFALAVLAIIGIMDLFVIEPFLARIITF